MSDEGLSSVYLEITPGTELGIACMQRQSVFRVGHHGTVVRKNPCASCPPHIPVSLLWEALQGGMGEHGDNDAMGVPGAQFVSACM